MQKDKTTETMKEVEKQFNEITNEKDKKVNEKIVEAVDTAKDIAERTIDFVGEAANAAGDFAEAQLKNAKSFMNRLNEDLSEAKYKRDKEKYKPIFADQLISNELVYPEMINVVENDKRMGIEACYGAVGYNDKKNGINIVGIYKQDINKFNNIEFYPNKTSYIYYVHPFDKNKYIRIDEYFTYLKEARVAELKKIAQQLGAKYFKVSIMEEKTIDAEKKTNAKAKLSFGKEKAEVDVKKEASEKKYEFIGVASESTFKNEGKQPVRPELRFWANNIAIENLIEQRLSEDSPLTHETYRLDYNTSTGITETEAVKIDGALKMLKFTGAGSISEKAKEESKRRFEYEIEF